MEQAGNAGSINRWKVSPKTSVICVILTILTSTLSYGQRFERTWTWSVPAPNYYNPEMLACAPRANGNTLISIRKQSGTGQGSAGVAELTPQGDTVWFRQFHRNDSYGDNFVTFIEELPDRKIFMAGGTHFSSGYYHAAFWLTDSLGNIQQYKQMVAQTNLNITIRDIDVAADGSIYFGGSYYDIYSGGVTFYDWTVPVYGKLNSNLTLAWGRTFGSTNHSNSNNNEGVVCGVKVTSDNNLIVMGNEGSPNAWGGGRMQLAKVNASGTTVWTRQRTLSNQAMVVGLALSPQNDIYAVMKLDAGNTVYGGMDIVVDKLNSNGTTIWSKASGTAYLDNPSKVKFDPSENALIVVGSHQYNGSDLGAWFSKIDTAGSFITNRHFGTGGQTESFNDVCRTPMNYVMVGSSGTSAYLVQTDLSGMTTCTINTLSFQTGAYNVPFSNGTSHSNHTFTITNQNTIYDNYSPAFTTNCYACSDVVRHTNITACGSYYAGGTTQTNSGTYYDTLPSFYGCDSIVITHLTIHASPTTSVAGPNQDVCTGSATLAGNTPSNGTGLWSVVQGTGNFSNASNPQTSVTGLSMGANIFRWTITSSQCSTSVSQVTITRHGPPAINLQTATPVICAGDAAVLNATGAAQYSWQPGSLSGASVSVTPVINTTYTVTGTDIYQCTNTATISIQVKQPTSSQLNITACNSYILNGQTYTNSGTYIQHTTNSVGCDSTINLNLTIKQNSASTLTQTACDSYTLNGQTYTSSGTYTQHLTNSVGCDSAITLNLTIKHSTASTVTQTACNSYTLNGQTYVASGTYTQHLTNSVGCDSAITLNLTIRHNTTSTINQTACETYTLNGVTYTNSGTYVQHLTNSVGCDSAITLNLTIRHNTFSTVTHTACDGYTINGQTYTSSGTYTQHLTNSVGCDSAITLNLTIRHSTASTLTHVACDSYTLNGQTYITSGTYVQHITNSVGCDSAITLHLTIRNSTASTINVATCTSYTLNGQTYTVSGTYIQHTMNSVGCDSAITLNLTIYQNTSSTLNIQSCGAYTLNGQTYTSGGTYTQLISNSNGCDSLITLNLTIYSIDNSISQNNGTLTANETNADYQWITCQNNAIIPGAIGQTYTATANGQYAVIVDNGVCVDTSACLTVATLGTEENETAALQVYPNPTTGLVTIASQYPFENATVKIYTITGDLIFVREINSGLSIQLDLTGYPEGIYIAEISHSGWISRTRIVKM